VRKIWDIPGGIHPAENKSQSNQLPISRISLPKVIILPLNQHIGAEALPTVNIGDRVLKGQRIAEAQGLVSAPIHASTSGKVITIENRPIPHPSGLEAKCIVIEPDGKEEWEVLEACENYSSVDRITLVEKIRNAGLAGLGGAGFPTAVKLSPRADHGINTLILNGTECEPYITADDVLMRERADDIIAGALLFGYLLNGPKEIVVGIEDNKPEAINAMRNAATGTAVEIVSFPTKYPSGGEKQLVQILTGKEVPSGGIPAQMGIVVQNVGTAAAAYRAVRYGEPLINRMTTVVGNSLTTQRNIEVLLGTPVDHVLAEHGFDSARCKELIVGGPMMGYAMERTDFPVVKTTNCILVPDTEEMHPQATAQPCIRCGMCAQACPASLLPQQLFWFAQSEDVDKLRSHHLFDCIECGACSYVCPSNIPLVQYYRASKGIIRQIDTDKQKSDRSRQRFEFRQERITKAEAQKEAKRLARKHAAEEAKRKLAAKQATESNEDSDPVASTANSTQQKRDNPEVQTAKLERAVSSAQSRVERAQAQLKETALTNDTARIETLQARLKQAEQKLADVQAKLAEYSDDSTTQAQATTAEKVSPSPEELPDKKIAILTKQLTTAEAKLAETEHSGSPTTEALKIGVEKLREKLIAAETQHHTFNTETGDRLQSAADIAIEKAKTKTQAMALMSEDEKNREHIASLQSRLDKARLRLAKAKEENNEHIEAFKNSVEKLENKLHEAKA